MIITSQCDQMIKQINTLKFNTLLKVIHVHLDLKKNLPNFSLEGPIIFLPLQFSYNYLSFVYVKLQSIASLLSYSIIIY